MKAIYAVLVLKISEFSNKEMELLDEKVHPFFKESYPNAINQQGNNVRIEINEKGETSQKVEPMLIVHRSSPNRKSAISITKSQLAFHTINFTDSNSFIAEGMSAFMKVQKALDIKFFGQVSARYVEAFDFDENSADNPFINFNCTHLIAPHFSSMPQRGPSFLEARNGDSELPIQSVLKVSVAIQEKLLPYDLVEAAENLFNFSKEIVPIFARIDIDSIFTDGDQLYPFDEREIQKKFTASADKIETLYKEIQGE